MRIFLIILTVLLLCSCSSTLQDYKNTQPSFTLENFFNGELKAWGMFQDRSGKVVRRFVVDMTGTWEGNKGVLDEWFVYDDGEKQRRTWELERLANGQYKGQAADVVGEASGAIEGFAFYWEYVLQLPVDDTVYNVTLKDWMYLVDDNVVINVSKVKKFGIDLGSVTLFIQKQ
ncbi:MAG: DUF3833 domain-containing protein [Pseudomonadota bacterium]